MVIHKIKIIHGDTLTEIEAGVNAYLAVLDGDSTISYDAYVDLHHENVYKSAVGFSRDRYDVRRYAVIQLDLIKEY